MKNITLNFNGSPFSHLLFTLFMSTKFGSPCFIPYIYTYCIISIISRLATATFFCDHIFKPSLPMPQKLIKYLYLKEKKYFIYTLFENTTYCKCIKQDFSIIAFLFISLTYFIHQFHLPNSFLSKSIDTSKISLMEQHSFEI